MLACVTKAPNFEFPSKRPSGPLEAGVQNPTIEGQSGGQDESIDTPYMAVGALGVKPPRLQNENDNIDYWSAP